MPTLFPPLDAGLTVHSGARHLSKFWANRDVGGAEDDVSLDTIVPSS